MCRAAAGPFDLDVYIDYIIEFLRFFRGDVHVMAVCQPTVPVFAAVALLEAKGDASWPALDDPHGRPDRCTGKPDRVNRFAEARTIDWFRRNVITQVPWPYPGVMRMVYPGFLQLSGFMGMNFDRHCHGHRDLFHNLIKGDGDSADKHREFYDEFLAVMDLAAEYYLQTIETVFLEHKLPRAQMVHRDRLVDPSKIRNVALMTVEGEKDDITGMGQTFAAQTLVHQPSRTMRNTIFSPVSAIMACSTAPAFALKLSRKSAILSPPIGVGEGCLRGSSTGLPEAEASVPRTPCATVPAAEFGGPPAVGSVTMLKRLNLARGETIEVKIRGLDIPMVLRRSARARRFSLQVNEARRGAALTMPLYSSFADADEFLSRHLDWLKERVAGLSAPVPFTHGAIIPLHG